MSGKRGKRSKRIKKGDKVLDISDQVLYGIDATLQVRKYFRKNYDVEGALDLGRKFYMPDEAILEACVEEKLLNNGYNLISTDEAPEHIQQIESPDIIAEKDGKYIVVEVKADRDARQLAHYSEAVRPDTRLILATILERGNLVEVWGLKDIENKKRT